MLQHAFWNFIENKNNENSTMKSNTNYVDYFEILASVPMKTTSNPQQPRMLQLMDFILNNIFENNGFH